MHEDPIIQEIRDIRRQIMAECDNDPDKLFQHYRELQKKLSRTHKIVSRSPRKLPRTASQG